jgi:DNA-binding XRE family transcriptional regulator
MQVMRPVQPDGEWSLDILRGPDSLPVVVGWKESKGFGVITPKEDDFGVGYHEVYATVPSVLERVVDLVVNGGETCPSRGLHLSELRTLCGVSQEELAKKLGVSQANVAAMERREDVLISTMAKVVHALGITLNIQAELPNGERRAIVL